MNAYMNINVRVLSAKAQAQIKALQTQVAMLEGQLARANATSNSTDGIGSARSRKTLGAWGNQLQWTGRQLQYNWTVPLALAGGVATKFALDNEKAMTRVTKVYGDSASAAQQFQKQLGMSAMEAEAEAARVFAEELEALEGAFVALSNQYGVAQTEVLETAGAWAAAGASGLALAESTELSLKAAVLGDMELAKATESLIAIQSQYSLSTRELNLTLAELNAIENQTGISMQGLIDGFSRSAGVAREAGVDVRHLGAMMAALVPATGSAATAGNALKTIISRLMSPTGDAADVMREFGVNTEEAAWQSSTAMERLQVLADHMNGTLHKTGEATADTADDMYKLSDSQKQVVASVLGSRYQMNRFLVLMRELGPEHTYYEKALDATADRSKAFAQATKELNAVLDSNPKRLEIMWRIMQNGMADAVQPMIPYIIYLASKVAELVTAFTNLDPSIQKFVLVSLIALAAVGPLVRYFGSLATLLWTLGRPLAIFVGLLAAVGAKFGILGGAASKVGTSIFGVAKSLLAMPFRLILSGMSSVISMILGMASVQGILAAATSAAAGVVAGIIPALLAGYKMVPVIFARMFSMAALVQTGALGIMLRGWAMHFVLMAKTASFSPILATFRLGLGLLQFMMIEWAAKAALAIMRLSVTLPLAFARMTGTMLLVWKSFQLAFMAAMATFRVTFLAGWTGIYVGMAAVTAAAHRVILAIQAGFAAASFALQTAMYRAWLALQAGWAAAAAAIQRGVAAAWALMHAGMMLVSRAFWGRIIALWIAAAVNLPRIIVLARNGIAAAWAGIVAVMTSGAVVSAAAALGPYLAVAAAIAGVLYVFRDQVAMIWNNVIGYFADSNNAVIQTILNAWNALPAGVTNALIAVARVVQKIALQIYEWFSYINPFAHHSPSLVENVTAGMARVQAEFAKAGKIKQHLTGAYAEIRKFGEATRGLIKSSEAYDRAQERAKIAKFAPGALKGYDALNRRLKQLKGDLARLDGAIGKQERVVDRWQKKVDQANAALDRQQKKLDQLTQKQQKWQDKLDSANDRLSKFANAPIKGMQAMSDKIFENEMAQKALRLEMMKMEDAVGSFDEIKSKMDSLAGAQELLSGTRSDLRSAGAGSEILSVYDDQIDKLSEQKKAYEGNYTQLQRMQDELDKLGRTAEMLDLENSLKFDPLTRAIEQAANALEEMSFDRIMAGVQAAQQDTALYTDKLDDATRAVNDQQKVVDALTESRDALQATLDAEQARLSALNDRYNDVAGAISDVEEAMNSAAAAADNMISKLEALKAAKEEKKKGKEGGGKNAAEMGGAVSPAVQNFRDAAGGNFANVGGAGIPVRTDWSSEAAKIEDFTANLGAKTSKMFDKVDMFGGIKEKWESFKSWMSSAWDQVAEAAKDFFSSAFKGTDIGGTDMFDKVLIAWAKVSDFFDKYVVKPISAIWRLMWPTIVDIFTNAWDGIKSAFDSIAPELKPTLDAIMGLWPILKPVVALIVGGIVLLGEVIGEVISNVIGPFFSNLGSLISNALKVFRGVIDLFVGLVTGDFTKIWSGIKDIVSGTFGAIWTLIKNFGQVIWGVVKGIVTGIFDFFVWLWDELVGHSVVPDIIDGILFWFGKLIDLAQWVWDNVLKPIWDFFVKIFDVVIAAVSLWWDGITGAWNALTKLAVWVWENVLKPVYDWFMDLWSKYVKPALAAWWEGIKAEWAALKKAAGWIWDNVLKPVWDKIQELWAKAKPELAEWWSRIQNVWSNLKQAAVWIWENVLKPVFEKVKELWEKAKVSLEFWWEGVKNAWNTLKALGTWIWDNVLKPVFEKVKELWDKAKTEFGEWKSRITGVWENLKTLGGWVKDNVMDPVFEKIKDGWTKVKDWMSGAKDMLTKPAKDIVGAVIGAVNLLIKGLNKIADVLPGFDWSISPIEFAKGGALPETAPFFAKGGAMPRRVGGGFKTNGARAIVGEGKANHPEYVIPTDPTYRGRARGLLADAASRLGMATMSIKPNGIAGDSKSDAARMIASGYAEYGLPKYGIGGVIGGIGDFVGGVWDDIKDLPDDVIDYLKDHSKDAASFLLKPFKGQADNILDKASWEVPRGMGKAASNYFWDWALAADKGIAKGSKDVLMQGGKGVQDAVKFAKAQAGKPYVWGGVGPGGYDCSGFMSALTNVILGRNPYSRVGATASFPWGGFSSGVGAFTIGSTPNYAGSGVGHMAGTLAGMNVESRGGQGVVLGSSARGYNDGGFSQVAHLTNAANGAIVRASRGGSLIRSGEAGRDEAIIPLPRGWDNPRYSPLTGVQEKGGDTIIRIEGDLSFPNITDPDDAETFIENLKSLAGGGQ